ncbi:hypothetical protein ACOSQ3_006956 [Xanthoceras sorbifolium]
MDTDGITKLCANINLLAEEGAVVHIERVEKEDGVKKILLCLVGKLLTTKLTNREAFRALITKIWLTIHAVEVKNFRDSIYAFHFQNAIDRKRVFMGGPWNFDNALLVLEIPSGYGDFSKMRFSHTDFWIQIQYIPLICMTKNISFLIGRRIGQVRDIDVGASRDCFGKFLHLRVTIDISKPLQRVIRVKLARMVKEKTLLIKYERLPEYCFGCSYLGHSYREFFKETADQGNCDSNEFPFGVWM